MTGEKDGDRRRWPWMIAAAVAGAAATGIALAMFQPWKLWVDDTVDEAAPAGAVAIVAPTTTPAADPTTTTSVAPPGTDAAPANPTASTAPATTPPPPPTTAPQPTTPPIPAGGQFISLDHGTSGTLALLQDPGGTRFVRLENLDTSNGPDLFVYLSTNPPDGPEGQFDDDVVNLGRLEGNLGSSNYVIPPETDLSRYASVVIWCDRFDSAFGAAPVG